DRADQPDLVDAGETARRATQRPASEDQSAVSRSSTGRGSGPRFTAAAALSRCSRLEYPTRTVETASELTASRTDASMRSETCPSLTSDCNARARATSVR